MSTMVERVARAIEGEVNRIVYDRQHVTIDDLVSVAHTAIEAMEPTWAMARAALDACPVAPDGIDPKEADVFVMLQEFRAMIQAALKEQA